MDVCFYTCIMRSDLKLLLCSTVNTENVASFQSDTSMITIMAEDAEMWFS